MSDVQLYLIEAGKDKKEASRLAGDTAQKLQAKELKLIDLIESLGEYLNNEDGVIRSKTISYLAEVLQAVPSKVLSGQQRNLLVDFVLSRISDNVEGIGSCAKALLALEELGQWDQEKASKVMTILLEQTHPLIQFKLQSDRYPVLLLIDLLLSKYRTAIHALHKDSPDFLPRFIAYFDGEKDPRNLMIIFSILRVVGIEWEISAHAQDLFEASFNYFPITFRPPPDDPYGITAQDLKDRLKSCISASAEFSPYSFPALLDKLDSTSMNVKRDVLQALISCVQEYGPHTVNLYAVTLWDSLKFEILHVQEEDLADEALKVFGEVGRQLSTGSPDSLVAYLKPVSKECNEHLEDAPTKQSQGATRMLHAISSSSPAACNFLLSAILPNLFQLYQGSKDVSKRRSLVETLAQLIRANIIVFGEWRKDFGSDQDDSNAATPEKYSKNALHDFTTKTLETLNTALTAAPVAQVSYRLVLVDALLQVAKVRALLSDDQITKIIGVFDHIVISEESYGKDDIKAAAMNALVEIAHQKPQLIINTSFPEFLGKLPDKDDSSLESYVPILEAFAKLGSEPKVFDTVILRLKNKLNAAIYQGASPSYIQSILSALLFASSQEAEAFHNHPTRTTAFDDLIKPLFTKVCLEATAEVQNDTTFYLVGRLANTVLRAQPEDLQKAVASEIYTLYLGNPLNESPPFNTAASLPQTRRIIISTYLIGALRREIPLPVEFSKILSSLINFASKDSQPTGIRLASLQQISLVLNKFVPTSDLKSTLSSLLSGPTDFLSTTSLTPARIRIVFAILKALILRNAPGLNDLFTLLTAALSNHDSGLQVAHGFATLLQPDEILTKDNHCIISPLHKQKTFAVLVPGLASGFRSADTKTRNNYLIALAGIIRWLPYAVLEPQLSSLSPLLLQTLDITGEEDVKAGTIDTLTTILSENPKAIEEHVGSLISRLLSSGSTKSNSVTVRSKALRCLTLVVVHLRMELIIPFRKQVVKHLIVPLDDRKRAVRVEAVRCRAKWIELDEAGDDDE